MSPPRIILGLGTGRCGTRSLANLLNRQPRTRITHEEPPRLPWNVKDRDAICRRLDRMQQTRQGEVIGDVASYFLPYAERAIEYSPSIRLVCLKRPRDEVVQSFMSWLDSVHPLPTNHWARVPATGVYHHPVWSRIFPQYDIQDREEGIGRYWDEYSERAESLEKQFPDNFRIFDWRTALTTQAGQHAMFDFCGYRAGEHVIDLRIHENKGQSAPVREAPGHKSDYPCDPGRCIVLVAYSAPVAPRCVESLQELERRGYCVRLQRIQDSPDLARNQMVSVALHTGYTETLWIDPSLEFAPDDVERMRRMGLPIVCGLHPTQSRQTLAPAPATGATSGNEASLLELQFAAAGLLFVRREVYERMQCDLDLPLCNEATFAPAVSFFQPIIGEFAGGPTYLPGEWAFCERARRCGFRVMADSRIILRSDLPTAAVVEQAEPLPLTHASTERDSATDEPLNGSNSAAAEPATAGAQPSLSPPSIAKGLASLVGRWPRAQSTSDEEPVFVLSAGWRSGSTLLQRALLSHCLVWGEPFGHSGILERLADPLRAFTGGWPEPHFIYDRQPIETLTEKFVANLYPPPVNLLKAYLDWFDGLFARPARAAGKARWGIKEVRLSADHATFLKWLYPQAKFLFLIRNPYDAFRSFAARRDKGWSWFHRWPEQPVTPEFFGRHWNDLASSFLAAGKALDGLVIRYEDLNADTWQQISDYVGFELSQAAISSNPKDGGPPPLQSLSATDIEPLRAAVEPLAGELGYGAAWRGASEHSSMQQSPAHPAPLTHSSTHRSISSQPPPNHAAAPARASSFTPCPPEKCSIVVPVADRVEPSCEASLRELERRGYRVSRAYGYKQIDLARCQMASDALASGCEETFWIDADTGFHPDMVERVRSHDEPIVCGIYPKKSKRELAIHAMAGMPDIVFGQGGGLIEILYAPTGFLLVRRSVYEKIKQQLNLPVCRADTGRMLVPYYSPLVRPDGDGWWYLADDFAFCERARQCGYKIMADTTVRLFHIGNYHYGWEDAGRTVPRFGRFKFHLADAVRKE
jgi:sulfotransferase family protein